jgi:hypothetical protein
MRNFPVVAGSFATLSAATMLIAACSGSANTASTAAPASSAPQSVATTPRPTPKLSPSLTVWTTAEAGKKYLALAAPSIADNAAYNKMTSDNSTLEQVRAQVLKLAKDDDVFARALAKGLWPARVRPKIDAMVEALATDRAGLLSASYAPTAYEAITKANSTGIEASAAGEAIRIALDLPAA